jgi:hypothetical protein
MKTLVKKERLVAIITENRAAHRDLFLRAVEGYRSFVTRELEDKLDQLRDGKLVESWSRYPIPEDHTRDYDRVLRMLDLDERDQMELTEQETAWFIMDDWEWKRQWNTSNTAYLVQ